ncbi:hypothetical protein B481_1378 [Planococcus halocryophilus Or1]|uniref:YdhG-like domain-containing protein n=1 Tax=Planococcus halocryophilus TaxID=1215089 RepID=A0A1C7DVG9_9BACL|nr:DUF1801 domain-containing protein [Planococcus halocryophilus]ANU15213.1 hypothetical protein BBI08_15735 [Planococcus halocryophilus]EMF46990.1 hypothetical protein B481_1378 [Planococcus halocryophilus Or1]
MSIQTIDEYIQQAPEDTREILRTLRKVIQEEAPEAKETIKYQMPTFVLNGNLVHFAAFKKHIGFYPVPSGIEAFQQELAPYKQGKGSVQFPLNQPIPYELIRKVVRFRIAENYKKANSKQ